MNTRGQSSRRRALEEDFLGIPLRKREDIAYFRQLKACPIKSTKWACPTMLNQLGIMRYFDRICSNVGLQYLIFQ